MSVPTAFSPQQDPSGSTAHLSELYERKYPDRVRVRLALMQLRKGKLPAKVKVSGLGTVYAGLEGWEVVK